MIACGIHENTPDPCPVCAAVRKEIKTWPTSPITVGHREKARLAGKRSLEVQRSSGKATMVKP